MLNIQNNESVTRARLPRVCWYVFLRSMSSIVHFYRHLSIIRSCRLHDLTVFYIYVAPYILGPPYKIIRSKYFLADSNLSDTIVYINCLRFGYQRLCATFVIYMIIYVCVYIITHVCIYNYNIYSKMSFLIRLSMVVPCWYHNKHGSYVLSSYKLKHVHNNSHEI